MCTCRLSLSLSLSLSFPSANGGSSRGNEEKEKFFQKKFRGLFSLFSSLFFFFVLAAFSRFVLSFDLHCSTKVEGSAGIGRRDDACSMLVNSLSLSTLAFENNWHITRNRSSFCFICRTRVSFSPLLALLVVSSETACVLTRHNPARRDSALRLQSTPHFHHILDNRRTSLKNHSERKPPSRR